MIIYRGDCMNYVEIKVSTGVTEVISSMLTNRSELVDLSIDIDNGVLTISNYLCETEKQDINVVESSISTFKANSLVDDVKKDRMAEALKGSLKTSWGDLDDFEVDLGF